MKLVAATLLFTLVGCATVRDIEGKDRGMFLPTGRVWVNLDPTNDGDTSSHKHVFGIEASATGGQGKFDIDLLSGETINAGGGTISGPTTVRTEFTMFEASVAVRGGTRIDRFNLHGIAGLGYHRTKLKLTSGATRLDRSIDSVGPLLGAHILFLATEWIEIYTRGSILVDFDSISAVQPERHDQPDCRVPVVALGAGELRPRHRRRHRRRGLCGRDRDPLLAPI